MAKTFSMGNTIETLEKTRQGKENTRNTRQHPVTRLVKGTKDKENRMSTLNCESTLL